MASNPLPESANTDPTSSSDSIAIDAQHSTTPAPVTISATPAPATPPPRTTPLDPFEGQDPPEVSARRGSLDETKFEAELRAPFADDSSSRVPTTEIHHKTKDQTKKESKEIILDGSTNGLQLTVDPLSVLQTPIFFNSAEFIQTASGNKVAVKSVLCGSHKIHMAGKSIIHPGVVLRGDLASLRIGKFVSVGRGTTLRPAFKTGKNTFGYVPMSIGDYVTIGENCVISAASISNHVLIGENCVIGKRCILKDCCVILPGTVLPPDTVVPSMTAFGGCPGRFVGDLYESAAPTQKKMAINIYRRFIPTALR